jgi:hypothetical protein
MTRLMQLEARRAAPKVAKRPDPDDLLTSAGIKPLLGDPSDMTLWRWARNEEFPEPDLTIARRKFWYRRTITGWRERKAAEAVKA